MVFIMACKPHLSFVIVDFRVGGAEKVLLNLVKALSPHYRIEIIALFDDGEYFDDYQKAASVTVLKSIRKLPGNIKKTVRYLMLRFWKYVPTCLVSRAYIQQSDLLVAYLEGIPTRLVSQVKGIAKVAWVHIDPVAFPYSQKYFPSFRHEVEAYQSMDQVICVSKGVQAQFASRFTSIHSTCVLHNLLDEKDIIESAAVRSFQSMNSRKQFLMIGKLMPQKGIDRCLLALCRLERKDWDLHIIGTGELQAELEHLVRQLSLADQVHFHGYQAFPWSCLKQVDCLISSSWAEGYSTVIAEARILHCPVLSTKTAGSEELVEHGVNGYLCDNSTEGLTAALKHLSHHNWTLLSHIQKGAETSVYSQHDVLEQTLHLFQQLIDKEGV